MSPWHTRCDDTTCYWHCSRPGCLEPGVHFLTRRPANRDFTQHIYDCTQPLSSARQAVEEMRPGMAPDEIAIARRVLLDALDRLEKLEKPRPSIFKETA